MPQQNISIIQGETKNFEFEHNAADINNRVWFTIYNGRDPVIYKESEKYGGGPDQIEIVATGNKKYIVKIKDFESEKLWLSNVSYKLYWINPTTEEMELLFWGSVNVSPLQQQEELTQLLGYKYIQVWDQLPDPDDFQEEDLVSINGQLKIKRNSAWDNIERTPKISVLNIAYDEINWSFTYILNEIGLEIPVVDEENPLIRISTQTDANRIIVQCLDYYRSDFQTLYSFGRMYSGSNEILLTIHSLSTVNDFKILFIAI